MEGPFDVVPLRAVGGRYHRRGPRFSRSSCSSRSLRDLCREALSITTKRGRPPPPDPAGGAGRTSCAQGGRDPTGQTISSHLSIWNAQSQTACLATTVLMLESSAFGSFDNRPAGRCKAGPLGLACGAGYQLVRISPGITAKDKEKTDSQRRRGRPGLC